jgi:hypothetical protein
MKRRSYRCPLLVTDCDRCLRRRACFPLWPGWICRQCVERMAVSADRALVAFAAQGFKVGK